MNQRKMVLMVAMAALILCGYYKQEPDPEPPTTLNVYLEQTEPESKTFLGEISEWIPDLSVPKWYKQEHEPELQTIIEEPEPKTFLGEISDCIPDLSVLKWYKQKPEPPTFPEEISDCISNWISARAIFALLCGLFILCCIICIYINQSSCLI